LTIQSPEPGKGSDLLIVIGSLQIGGTETHIAAIAPALQRLGWSVSVYSLGGDGPLRERLQRQNVRVIVPPVARRRSGFAGAFAVVKLMTVAFHLLTQMMRMRPTVVHFFLPEAYLVGGLLAVVARLPVRVMSRRSLNVYSQHRRLVRKIEIRLHRTMSAILGNSRSVVRELHDVEYVPAERLGLIYNGIDAALFYRPEVRATMRASLALAPATVAMITIGNLIPYKGHADLIAALRLGAGGLPADWRLFIVGRDDGVGADLRRQVAAAGLNDRIVFLGERRDIGELLSACDIGLLCSHQEGFSNAVLEGMASGLPMVVTDVGGNREAVADEDCGFIVPAHDPDRLAQAIVTLSGDAAMRGRFGAAGRARVRERFSIGECVAKYDRFYRAMRDGGGLAACPELRVRFDEPAAT
jgi:glycosyltransferase involved in cell wall biosynthesis